MTWTVCQDAIQQCCEESDGLFFLSLQSDRYGYLPLPKHLGQEIILQSLQNRQDSEQFSEIESTVRKWYKLDENHVPPRYELKNLHSINDTDYFDLSLPLLRDILLDGIPFETFPFGLNGKESLLINHSVTEWETLFGLHCDKERCYWIERAFDKETLMKSMNHPDCFKMSDALSDLSVRKKLEAFRNKMQVSLKPHQHFIVSTKASPIEYLEGTSTIVQNYLKEWESAATSLLQNELTNIEKKKLDWIHESQNTCGIPVDHIEEILHHSNFLLKKTKHFFGREKLFEIALAMITKKQQESSESFLSCITLALIGKSGCGKTSLISKLAYHLASTTRMVAPTQEHAILPSTNDKQPEKKKRGLFSGLKEKFYSTKAVKQPLPPASQILQVSPTPQTYTPVVIVRYCGTSKYSLNGMKLMQSIIIQLLLANEEKEKLIEFVAKIPKQDYKEAVEQFQEFLLQFPVFLFVDSLDQLENHHEERSKLSFLRGSQLHPLSKIIVSCLPDEYGDQKDETRKYFYQCAKAIKANNVPVLEVGMMDSIDCMIEHFLKKNNRILSSDQWKVVLNAVSHEPSILYINLAVEVVVKWKSYDKEMILKPTVKGIINQIFDDLEKNFGPQFVSVALAMITFSREGISDNEMKDVLSLHPEVLQEVFQYSTSHLFPMHVWLRLKHIIKNLITEKENHCIKWYHRQLWETATERYAEKKKECHEIMGSYFGNLIEQDIVRAKQIREQPVSFDGKSVWSTDCIVNRRRVIEGYYHLIEGGLLVEAIDEMCSLEAVYASGFCEDLYEFLVSMGKLETAFNQHQCLEAIQIMDEEKEEAQSSAIEPTIFNLPSDPDIKETFNSTNLEAKPIASRAFWNHLNSKLLIGLFVALSIILRYSAVGALVTALIAPWCLFYTQVVIARGNLDKTFEEPPIELVNGEKESTVSLEELSCTDDGKAESPKSHHEIFIEAKRQKLHHYYSWIKRRIGQIHSNPRSMVPVTAAEEPLISKVRQDIISRQQKRKEDSMDWMLFPVLNFPEVVTFSALELELPEKSEVTVVVWSHSGEWFAAGVGSNVKIYDGLSGKVIETLERPLGKVTSVAWSLDDSMLAFSAIENTIHIDQEKGGTYQDKYDDPINVWNTRTGELLHELVGHSSWVLSVSWNPSVNHRLQLLSGSNDLTLKIWDVKEGLLIKTIEGGHTQRIQCVAWSPDGCKIVSGAQNGAIIIWDAVHGNLLHVLEGHSGNNVTSVAWNHNGSQIVSGSDDRTIKIWDGDHGLLLKTMEKCGRIAYWSHDSTKIVDNSIKIRDGNTGTVLASFDCVSTIYSISWNYNNTKIVSSSYDNIIRIWNASDGFTHPSGIVECDAKEENIHSVGGHSLSCNKDCSKIAVVSTGLTIWDVTSGELWKHWKVTDNDSIRCLEWSHDDRKIVSGGHYLIKIWDVETEELLQSLTGHTYAVSCVSWNGNDTRIASASYDNTVRLWDAVNGSLLKVFEDHSWVETVAWSADNHQIASGGWGRIVYVWNVTSERLVHTLEGHTQGVVALAFSHSGNVIASGSWDHTVKLWNGNSGKLLRTCEAHTDGILSLAWSPDDRKIIAGCNDGVLKIWNVGTGKLIKTLESYSRVRSVVWTKDGKKIIAGHEQSSLKLWNLEDFTKCKE